MSGGPRHWNEETQRWEDPGGPAATSPPTLPDQTPLRPMTPPAAPPVPPPWYGPEPGVTVPPAPETVTWPSSPPPPPPPPPLPAPASSGHGRRLALTVIIGAAAAGVAVSLVLTLVIGGGKNDAHPKTTPTGTTTSASPAPASPPTSATTPAGTPESAGFPSATGTATAPFNGAAQLPAGYESYQDDQGFRIARPKGWSRTTVGSVFGIRVVNYRSPDRKRRLQVYQVEEASPDASFNLFLSDQTVKPAGFRSLSREKLDDTAGFTGTRLTWTATRIKGEPDVGTWHVYDERFVAPDGNIYAIAAYGPDTKSHRSEDLQLLTTALTWFCPAGAACEDPQD